MKLVIDIEQEWYERACKATISLDGALPIYQSIKEGTPYEDQRPHGEWTYTTHYARRFRVCSVCKAEKEDDHASGWNYCQYCGASMVKEGEVE